MKIPNLYISEYLRKKYVKYSDIKHIKHNDRMLMKLINYQCANNIELNLCELINDYVIELQRYRDLEFSKDAVIYDNLSQISITSFLRFGDYSMLADFTNEYKRLIFSDFKLWHKQYKKLNAHEFKLHCNTLKVNTMNGIDVFIQSINSQYGTELLECEDVIQYICTYSNNDYLSQMRPVYFELCKIFKTDFDNEKSFVNDILSVISELSDKREVIYNIDIDTIESDLIPNAIDINIYNELFSHIETEASNCVEILAVIDDGDFWD